MPDFTKPREITPEEEARARAILEKVSYTQSEWDEEQKKGRIRKLLADAVASVPSEDK